MNRIDLIKQRLESIQKEKSDMFDAQDIEIIQDMIKNHHQQMSDEKIAELINEKKLLVNKTVTVSTIVAARKSLGLQRPRGRGTSCQKAAAKRRRSTKTREVILEAPGDNHPVTIHQLYGAINVAEESITKAKDMVQKFARQEKARFEV